MNTSTIATSFRSARTRDFQESVIREMTRLAVKAGAVNLAQGFPDFPSPAELKEAAIEGISRDHNQYSITWGAKPFREAIARKYLRSYTLTADPETEITACCGATEGMIAALLAVTNPGDEIIVFEPFYENYHPDALLCGVERKVVRLREPDWNFDPDELRAQFTSRTRAIVINTPHNPTGKVFTLQEMSCIGALCRQFDTIAITDEIYEHIIYDGLKHIPMITLPGMRDRTVLVNSMSKTYSVTGWRVGWMIAAPALTAAIRKVHDFLTVNAPTPLQYAGVKALDLPDSYFNGLSFEYDARRQQALAMLTGAGFRCSVPKGAYYVMADARDLGISNDRTFAEWMIETVGVAGVPGSSFYSKAQDGCSQIRFCFCKKDETLREAENKLAAVRQLLAARNSGETR